MQKSVLITGAAGYIGDALCSMYISNGWQVGAIDINKASCVCSVAEVCDVTNTVATQQAIESVAKKLNGIDSIICCAGQMMSKDGSIGVVTSEVMSKTFEVNVLGTYNAIHAALPHLRKSEFPSIIIIGSLVASFGSASSELAYTTSKGAVEAMVREMAVSLARDNIRVNCVSPGPLSGGCFPMKPNTPNERNRLDRIPLGRRGTCDDVAGACFYLTSKQASYITGAFLAVDGGASVAFLAQNPEGL